MVNEKISFKNLLTKNQWCGVIGFFIVFLGLLIYTFFSGNKYDGPAPKRIQINKGASLGEIANTLYNAKIIPSKFNFKLAAFFYAAEKRIKAGRYNIPSGLSYLGLLEKFIDGDGDLLKAVDVYDGISITGLKNKLEKTVSVNGKEFVSLISNKKFLDELGFKEKSLEGYFLPGEYDFYEHSSAKEVAAEMYKRFQRFYTDSLKTRISKIGFKLHQVITMASIVQGETRNESEMPIIAGVYYNRLKIGMRLQADPTIQYLQEKGWKRLSFNDLKAESPYNTYKNKGLPPGPINNPGKKAIMASLNPKQHGYIYFVATGKGTHNFSRTFAEHIAYAKEYRKKLDSKK